MCKFSSKSGGGVPFQPLGDLTWNDPPVDGSFSNFADAESGVPQRPVLCPLLFLLHINDLPSCVNSKVRLFADDCLLYREIKNNQDQIDMQRDLDALMDWGSTWGMKFNAKSVTLSITYLMKKSMYWNLEFFNL